jgi:hypothetical protein
LYNDCSTSALNISSASNSGRPALDLRSCARNSASGSRNNSQLTVALSLSSGSPPRAQLFHAKLQTEQSIHHRRDLLRRQNQQQLERWLTLSYRLKREFLEMAISDLNGERGGNRTHDQRLKRPLLYRLSYALDAG